MLQTNVRLSTKGIEKKMMYTHDITSLNSDIKY